MKDIKAAMAAKKTQMEAYLAAYPPGEEGRLREAMTYSLQNGGKRLRPAVFLLVTEVYGATVETVLPFAAGLEMIHTYSLIHDDLPAMDNDDYRRGKLTNHKVFGDATAILAGDGLLTEAFARMTSIKAAIPAERVLAAVSRVASLAGVGGMVQGQVKDIAGEGKALSLRELKEIHALKTGALLRAALVSAAILADAPLRDRKALEIYGGELGLAFQIADDILDYEGTFADLGKPIGSDAANQKTTYISLLGLKGAKSEGEAAAARAKAALNGLSVDTRLLSDLCDLVLARKN